MIARLTPLLFGLMVLSRAGLASPDSVARYAAPLGAPYTAEEVRIRMPGGNVLAGTLTMPNSRLPAARRPLAPVMLLISGSPKQDRDLSGSGGYRPFFQLADTLSRRGVAVLRLDDPGVGASTGSLDSMDTVDRANDVRAVLAFLRKRPGLAKDKIGLLGHSEGAMIAPIVAATEPGVRAVVLLGSPARSGREVVRWQRRRRLERDTTLTQAQRDSIFAAGMIQWEEKAKGDRWTRFFADYDPVVTARRVHAPVLILQGTADESVPSADAEALAGVFRDAGNRDVTQKYFIGMTHSFVFAADFGSAGALHPGAAKLAPDLLGVIADWTASHLVRF